MRLGINITKWILAIVGSIALLFFIYGGLTFLISAGNTAAVDRGKKILGGAVVGLVIVFASYLIIKFVLQAIDYKYLSDWGATGVSVNVH